MAANNMTHLPIFDNIVIHHGKIGYCTHECRFVLKNVIYGNNQINLKKIEFDLYKNAPIIAEMYNKTFWGIVLDVNDHNPF